MSNKKVYLIGGERGKYRNQNLVKFLLDQQFQVYYNNFSPNIFSDSKGIWKIFRVLIKILNAVIQFSSRIYNLLLADYVFMTAMSQDKQTELLLAKLFKKYIITDFYLSMYDTFVNDREQTTKGSYKAKKLFRQDKNAIERAKKVFFLNKTEAKYYLGLFGQNFEGTKHKIVPLCVEQKEKCKLSYFSKKSNDTIFNICWWGSYIPLHGLEKIIDAAKVLKNEYRLNFHIHLFGNNEEKSISYKTKIEKLELTDVVTIHNDKTFNNGKLEPYLVKDCSLVLGNFGESVKAKRVLVNKIIDGIALRAPVLTGESIAPKEYFSHNQIFYSNNEANSIAEKIYEISQFDKDSIRNKVDECFEIYELNFSIKAYERNLKEIFRCSY